ncbi:MAG: ATP-grasp domain-containing protein [Planctomycetota bacterium]
MHLFLYEWITGGGLVEEPSPLPTSMLSEGSAMATALAADLSGIEGARVSVLRDIRLDDVPFPDCDVVEVHSSTHREDEFERLAASADHTFLVAPETDNILIDTLRNAHAAGGRPLAPSEDFVALASDKDKTAAALARAGVPVPQATSLSADEEKLPDDFDYPAVLKPVLGAGSQHTLLVAGSRDEPPPYPWPRRLEKYCPGIAASVSALCGPSHRTLMAPCRQTLSADGRFTYHGGSLIRETELARRAKELADRALDALPPAIGYVGIDLVLGKSGDGSADFVIEVNPRLTTSYVGLRASTSDNLAIAMIDNAAGRASSPRFHDHQLEFTADGTILQTS